MGYKKTGIQPGADAVTYEVKVGDKVCKYEVRKPGEKEIFLAFKHMLRTEPDLLGAGRAIWETCVVGYDDEVRNDVKTFVAVCLDLQAEHVAISEEEIKKKPAAK